MNLPLLRMDFNLRLEGDVHVRNVKVMGIFVHCGTLHRYHVQRTSMTNVGAEQETNSVPSCRPRILYACSTQHSVAHIGLAYFWMIWRVHMARILRGEIINKRMG